MSAPDTRTYVLTEQNRAWVASLVNESSIGWRVTIRPPGRTPDQNAKAHAMFQDIARAKPEWNGIRMDAEDWKALMVVSHAVATQGDSGLRLVPDLEGRGLVQLRESTARMSKDRASSLIEYTVAWCTSHGIQLRETEPDVIAR